MKLLSKLYKQHFKFKRGDAVLTLLSFASMGLGIWASIIYRLTIIHNSLLFLVSFVGTVIAFFLISLFIRSSYQKIWIVFISLVIGSGTFCFGMLFLNKAFSNKEIVTEDFQIIKKGTLDKGRSSRCYQPYATIDFYETQKQLVFYCDFAESVKKSSRVRLTYSEGLFGFYIIKSKQLMR